MCRENGNWTFTGVIYEETSLHVQRKRHLQGNDILQYRNISACAEKTYRSNVTLTREQKHLCMCRENTAAQAESPHHKETSLHVQRKLLIV